MVCVTKQTLHTANNSNSAGTAGSRPMVTVPRTKRTWVPIWAEVVGSISRYVDHYYEQRSERLMVALFFCRTVRGSLMALRQRRGKVLAQAGFTNKSISIFSDYHQSFELPGVWLNVSLGILQGHLCSGEMEKGKTDLGPSQS